MSSPPGVWVYCEISGFIYFCSLPSSLFHRIWYYTFSLLTWTPHCALRWISNVLSTAPSCPLKSSTDFLLRFDDRNPLGSVSHIAAWKSYFHISEFSARKNAIQCWYYWFFFNASKIHKTHFLYDKSSIAQLWSVFFWLPSPPPAHSTTVFRPFFWMWKRNPSNCIVPPNPHSDSKLPWITWIVVDCCRNQYCFIITLIQCPITHWFVLRTSGFTPVCLIPKALFFFPK